MIEIAKNALIPMGVGVATGFVLAGEVETSTSKVAKLSQPFFEDPAEIPWKKLVAETFSIVAVGAVARMVGVSLLGREDGRR